MFGLILTALAYKKIDKSYKKIYLFSLITGIICIIMSLRFFPFEKMPSILKMIQFTFRLLEFSSFFFAFIASINYSVVIKDFQMKDIVVLSTICILLVVPYVKRINFDKEWNEEALWPAVSVNDNTGRVHAGCATFEYLPSKAFENLDYIKHRANTIYILKGYANIEDEQKNGTEMEFYITDIKQDTSLELPYIYYLGYTAIYENGETEEKLELTQSENGFVMLDIKEGMTGKITVKYTGTPLMISSYIISIITFLGIIIVFVISNIKTRKNKQEKIK